jgi:DNA-binding PadR family transcriptional regulator
MSKSHERGLDRELKKGSAELLVLSLTDARARHGYEIARLIETGSQGAIRFNVASLYPLLYRLEKRGWIRGTWVEKPGQRRRFCRLTPAGRRVLASQRSGWRNFVAAIDRIVALDPARPDVPVSVRQSRLLPGDGHSAARRPLLRCT